MDTDVGVETSDRILQHVAIPPMKLHAFISNTPDEFRRPQLSLSRQLGSKVPAVLFHYATIDKNLTQINLSSHFGELKTRILKISERMAECLSVFYVG